MKNYKTYLYIYWSLFGIFMITFIGVFILAAYGVFGEMPSFDILENPDTNLATEILSEEEITLGKIYLNDNRTPLDYQDLSPYLVKALVATEDERFFRHSGIDLKGTLRAIFFLGSKGGGSTISQQLARQLFVGVRSKNIGEAIIQKVKEWVIAIQLERNYTKEEIIAMYFNIYDFNNQADGIRSASRIYYGKEPKNLDIEQSATLVGMFKNSSLYNPRRNPEGVINRRNVVLYQMYKHSIISLMVKNELQEKSLSVNFHPETHDAGTATYFREYLRYYLKKWIKKNPKSDGSYYNLYKDGLKVYTTINARMQKHAEQAMRTHLKRLQRVFYRRNNKEKNPTAPFVGLSEEELERTLERSMRQSERWRHLTKDLKKSVKETKASFMKKRKMAVFSWKGDIDTLMTPYDSIMYYKYFLRSGMTSIEPQTGKIKTWVGGANYKHFKYDQVIQGARQAGSTFKPFVYATAIDQLGLSPCDKYPDVQYCIEVGKYNNKESWCPNNTGDRFSGKMKTLKQALANSINTITATLIDKVGPRPVVKLIKKLGISSHVPPVPSIGLGTPDVKLLEMVSAYATFINKGIYIEPSIISRIEDENGNIIFQNKPKSRDVLSEEISYTITNLLMGVTKYGSGRRLRDSYAANNRVYKQIVTGYPYDFKNEIAGKTGTTQNNSDGWFIGMVPNLATGVWVGGEDRSIHFESTIYGQGATMALPIWALFMKKCYADEHLNVSQENFDKPENMTINLDCDYTGVNQDEENGNDYREQIKEKETKKEIIGVDF